MQKYKNIIIVCLKIFQRNLEYLLKTAHLCLYELKRLFIPRYCPLCEKLIGKNEGCFCLECISTIPITYNWTFTDNIIYKKIYDKCVIRYGASLMDFEKSNISQKIIHSIKYENRREIGIEMGRYFGKKLSESPFFNDLDYIIALPLHKRKEIERGYNQSMMIALGISEILNVKINKTAVVRIKNNRSQTSMKNAEERLRNVEEIFSVIHPEELNNKNILIIDDVSTTGATISSMAKAINKATKNCTVNIAILAS